MTWHRVASVSQLPPDSTLEVVAGGRIVAVIRAGESFFALDGVCPHQGGPLGQGSIEGTTLTCPWHGWQFDVASGRNCLNARIVQPSFPVRIEGDDVLVDLPPTV